VGRREAAGWRRRCFPLGLVMVLLWRVGRGKMGRSALRGGEGSVRGSVGSLVVVAGFVAGKGDARLVLVLLGFVR
jgi:hypothetical protein